MPAPRCPAPLLPLLLAFAAALPLPAVETLPPEQVEPGMLGTWRTVVRGDGVEEFEMEVLAVFENFFAPGRTIILCQALDAQNRLTGPVAGMSGSPAYINGKLIGAYAYGWMWAKDQALIGITPIGEMLEVLDKPDLAPSWQRAGTLPYRPALGAPQVASGGAALPAADDPAAMAALLQPVPTPLMASGFSPAVVEAFRDDFAEMGLELVSGPSALAYTAGSRQLPADGSNIEAGSPLAAVLMQGDLTVSATGTATWREGDTILGWGHPFIGAGAPLLPMSGARTTIVVQSYPKSYKMSELGPVVGAITQDRLTAIRAEVGREAPVTPMRVTVRGPEGQPEHVYEVQLARHPGLTPRLAAMGLMQMLSETLENAEKETFRLRLRIEAKDTEPVELTEVASGPGAAFAAASALAEPLGVLWENPYAVIESTAIEVEVERVRGWELNNLQAVRITGGQARPGGELEIELRLWNYHEEMLTRTLTVPLPESLRAGERIALTVADAAHAVELRGQKLESATRLDDLLDNLRARRSSGQLYVFLLRTEAGLRVEGSNLPALPPSLRGSYDSGSHHLVKEPLGYHILSEQAIDLPGTFEGHYTVPLLVQ